MSTLGASRAVVYLDHASTSWPKAAGVGAAMSAALEIAGSSGRGGGVGAGEARRIDDRLRAALAEVIHARDPRRVVLTSGATESLNMAILGVVRAARSSGRQRPRVVTTQVEHNAVRRPLLALASLGEIELCTVEARADARVSALRVLMEAAAGVGERAADVVVMGWASNVTGAIQPVEEVGRALRGTDTLLMVDASQSAGLVRPERDLESAGVDMLALSGHKALGGPAGVGALYIGPKAHPLVSERRGAGRDSGARVEPVLLGGTGGESESAGMPAALPGRFEAGTAGTPARAGLLAALRDGPSPAAALAHVRAMVDRLIEGVASVGAAAGGTRGRVRLHGLGPGDRVGVFCLAVDGYAPDELAAILESEFGIVVRAGLHCAPGAHEAIGTLGAGGTVRVSVGRTTTVADVEALVEALGRIALA